MEDQESSPWSESDDQTRTEEFVDHLDRSLEKTEIQRYKTRSHELLAPGEGDRILDVGCGVGDDVRALAEAVGSTGEVVGVDNSEEMIAEARERSTDEMPVTFRVDDAVSLSFPDATFDAARTDLVLLHLDDPGAAIEELVRVTRPGGRVGLTDMDWGTSVMDLPKADPELTALIEDPKRKDARHPNIGRELYRRAKQAGLTDLTVDPVVLSGTDYEFYVEQNNFTGILEELETEGLVTAAEADRWLDQLYEAGERGVFFAALTVFTVVGTVPHE